MKQTKVIPTNLETMYSEYFEGSSAFVPSVVRKMMPYSSDADREDLVGDILLRSIEHDIIGKFDASITKDFAGLVFTVVRSVVANKCRKVAQHGTIASLTETVGEEFVKGTYALDTHFAVQPAKNHTIEDSRLSAMFRYAKERLLANKCKRDQSLHAMMNMLLEGYDHKDIAKALGVQPSTVSGWLTYTVDHANMMA